MYDLHTIKKLNKEAIKKSEPKSKRNTKIHIDWDYREYHPDIIKTKVIVNK